ncbi:MAG: SEL1-like repeat protein [Gammaproteobacteria bacterium]|nr:SEL1-like repeat protein [Gammaproteobacteria bacterium]
MARKENGRGKARQGNPAAMHELSQLYALGELVPRDEAKALDHLRRAAEEG